MTKRIELTEEQQKAYDQGKTSVTPQEIAAMNTSINTFKDSNAEAIRKAIATNSPDLPYMLRAVPEEARKKYNLPPAPPLPKSDLTPDQIKKLIDSGELSPF